MKSFMKKCAAFLLSAALLTGGFVFPAAAFEREADGVIVVTQADIDREGFTWAVQDALDEARNTATDDAPCTVIVPEGSYDQRYALRIYSNTTLDLRGVTIRRSGAGAGNMLRVGDEDGENTGVTTTATSVKAQSVMGTYLDGHTLYVTNGARFTLAGTFDLGASWQHSTAGDRAANRNVLRIAHGATMEAAVLNVGVHHEYNSSPVYLARESGVTSCSNDIQVLSGGKLACRNLFLGANQCSYGNRMTVADDALLQMKGDVSSSTGLHIGYYGSGNELVLSNVTGYTESNLLPEFLIGGHAGSSNNVFRITGAGSHVRFSGTGTDRFGFGSSNELIVENGAFLDTVDTRWNSMTSCTGCTLRVRGNARLKVDRTLYVGAATKGAGCGNRVVIEDGGSFTNYSGGILLALSAGIAADCPYPNGLELKNGRADMQALTVSTNCYVEFSGTNPVLRATAGCSVAGLGKLRFVVPKTGYLSTPYTITSSNKGLTMEEGSALEIDLSSKPYLDEPLTLVSCAKAMTIPASVLTAANEALGKKGQVYLDPTGKKLMLRVWRKGTSVYLR